MGAAGLRCGLAAAALSVGRRAGGGRGPFDTYNTHVRALIRSVWQRYIPPIGGYGKVKK